MQQMAPYVTSCKARSAALAASAYLLILLTLKMTEIREMEEKASSILHDGLNSHAAC